MDRSGVSTCTAAGLTEWQERGERRQIAGRCLPIAWGLRDCKDLHFIAIAEKPERNEEQMLPSVVLGFRESIEGGDVHYLFALLHYPVRVFRKSFQRCPNERPDRCRKS